MNQLQKHQALSIEERCWAKDKVDDVFYGCILNTRLYGAGIAPKLIVEMDTPGDMADYLGIVSEIFDLRPKA